jgi:hypothetical protein
MSSHEHENDVSRATKSPRKKHAELSDEERLRANCRACANAYQRRGIIVPQSCEKCGTEKAQKHHEDYSKPLEVRWLCKACHLLEHGGSTKPAENGHGNCARCDSPKLPGSAYCRNHKNAYQRDWLKARTEELKLLRSISRGEG